MMKRAFTLKPSALAVVAALGISYTPVLFAGGLDSHFVNGEISQLNLSGPGYDIVEVSDNGGIVNNDFNGGYAFQYSSTGFIQDFNNRGYISSTNYSIVNQGLIHNLNNFRVIDTRPNGSNINQEKVVIYNDFGARIASLNNYSLINAINFDPNAEAYAIKNYGVIDVIHNEGTINGNIYSSTGLTIIGSTTSNPGILGGLMMGSPSGISKITIDNGDLIFASGSQILNSNVSAAATNNIAAQLYLSDKIAINGNYNQSKDASLNIYVNPGAQTDSLTSGSGYGQLLVNGAANVAAGSAINLVSQGYNFAEGQRYVVITATDLQGTEYHAGDLNYSATEWDKSIKGMALDDLATNRRLLVVTLGSKKDDSNSENNGGGNNSGGNDHDGPDVIIKKPIPTQPNATSSLSGLQKYSGVSDAGLLNLYNASLAISSTSEANKAGEQLSPGQTLNARTAISTTTFDMLNVVGSRVASVQLARANGGQSGIAAGDDAADSAVWGQVFNGWVNQGTTDSMSGYKANYSGLVIGADRNITDEVLLGGAVSYTSTNVKGQDNASGSNSYVNSWGLTAYASYKAQDWYTGLYATAVNQNYRTQRQVDFTGYSAIANGKFDGQQYALKGEFGYPLALTQATTLTPMATLSYSYIRQDGYTETNGNGAALRVEGSNSDSLKSGLGAKLETTQATPWGDVVPYVQVLWGHQYDSKATDVTASYAAAVNETSFVTKGSTPEKDSVDVNVGATLMQSDTTSISAYYDISAAQDYTNQSVSLRLRKLF